MTFLDARERSRTKTSGFLFFRLLFKNPFGRVPPLVRRGVLGAGQCRAELQPRSLLLPL
ncbi:MAG TPA: hypothetical protein VFZ53_28380 [Polyangiaceae bacterium]